MTLKAFQNKLQCCTPGAHQSECLPKPTGCIAHILPSASLPHVHVEGGRRYSAGAEDEPLLLLSMFCVKCNKKATSLIYQVAVTVVHMEEKHWYKNVYSFSEAAKWDVLACIMYYSKTQLAVYPVALTDWHFKVFVSISMQYL